ncbi:hypothetical protein ACU8V7_16520 [Zobellia nedashkovskayae]
MYEPFGYSINIFNREWSRGFRSSSSSSSSSSSATEVIKEEELEGNRGFGIKKKGPDQNELIGTWK